MALAKYLILALRYGKPTEREEKRRENKRRRRKKEEQKEKEKQRYGIYICLDYEWKTSMEKVYGMV